MPPFLIPHFLKDFSCLLEVIRRPGYGSIGSFVFIERWIRTFPKHGIALSFFSLAHFEYLPNILPMHPRQFLHLYYITRLAHLPTTANPIWFSRLDVIVVRLEALTMASPERSIPVIQSFSFVLYIYPANSCWPDETIFTFVLNPHYSLHLHILPKSKVTLIRRRPPFHN
jgi:hypothetical protein